jgi:glucose/arabinose dehydrogenase
VVTNPEAEKALFLDIAGKVYRGHNEEGLLALAFHPKFPESRFLYVYYCAEAPRRTIVARYTAAADGMSADPASGQILMEIAQPFGNHKGSDLVFGPDGFLYLSPGDGGSGGDPHGNGQKLDTLLGKILRIDVDKQDAGLAYAIPPDNPFVGQAGARGEIWAYGIRNVWRMTFDRKTGDLWAGDVGQNIWEEVDIIVKGGNYGWNLREGKHPFENKKPVDGLIDPIVEYGRQLGSSITGGYVYRGKASKQLQGVYHYADFASGRIFGVKFENKKVVANVELVNTGLNISSFGEDGKGELYITAFDGRIYKLVQ